MKKFKQFTVNFMNNISESVQKLLLHDDPTRRCSDISLAKAEPGWEPLVASKEGFKKTIGYFKEMISEEQG